MGDAEKKTQGVSEVPGKREEKSMPGGDWNIKQT